MSTKAGGVYIDIRGSDKNLKGDLDKAHKKVTASAKSMQSQVTKAFKVMSVAAVASLAAISYGLIKLSKDSALLAARFKTMGIVMHQVGGNAGYSASQMNEFDVALRKTGISMIESRNNLTKMAQAQLDLTKASNLGRIAQDAAVIGGINSSEAFSRMIDGIQRGSGIVLKTIGININFANTYKAVAKATDRTVASFSESEKVIIRQNAVIEYGSRIAGVYEAAMGTAGKKLSSFTRYVEDFKVKMGTAFGPAMVIMIDSATAAMKQMQVEISKPETQIALDTIAVGLAKIVASLSTDIPGKFDAIQSRLVFLIDAGDGVLRVFEIVGKSIALLALDVEWALLKLADGITVGPIAALNNMITLMNRIPGIPTVPFIKATNIIRDRLDIASGAIALAERDIESLFTTDLAGTKLLKGAQAASVEFSKVREEAKKMAAAVASDEDRFGSEEGRGRAKAVLAKQEADQAQKTADIKKKTLAEYASFYDNIMLSTYELDKKALDADFEHFKSILGEKEGLQVAYNTRLNELKRERDEGIVSKVDSSLSSFFEEIDTKTEAYKTAEEARLEIVAEANQRFADLSKTKFDLEREQVAQMVEVYRNAKVDENIISKLASDRNLEIARAEQTAKLDLYKNIAGSVSNTFQMIAQAGGEQSAKAFKIQKAFALVEAGINVYQGVTKALAQGGFLGILNGALVAAAGAAQISMIANSQPPSYDQGGVSNAAGVYQTGPIQEAHVPIPSGKIPVTINGKDSAEQQPPPQVNVKNINVLDPAIVNDYLDTSEGEQVIVNIMQRNRAIMEN